MNGIGYLQQATDLTSMTVRNLLRATAVLEDAGEVAGAVCPESALSDALEMALLGKKIFNEMALLVERDFGQGEDFGQL
jgi:hypothetical protein